MEELWMPVCGWEGFYEVSSFGQVRTVARETRLRNRWGGENVRRLPVRIMAQTQFAERYWQVTLKEGGRRQTEYVHRLVCRAFNGEPAKNTPQVAHWDGNGLNNKSSNLRWATVAENNNDKIRHGTSNRGEAHPLSVLTVDAVMQIKSQPDNGKDAIYAEMLGVSVATVSQIRRGHSWKWIG